jgi:hypothetical protein
MFNFAPRYKNSYKKSLRISDKSSIDFIDMNGVGYDMMYSLIYLISRTGWKPNGRDPAEGRLLGANVFIEILPAFCRGSMHDSRDFAPKL